MSQFPPLNDSRHFKSLFFVSFRLNFDYKLYYCKQVLLLSLVLPVRHGTEGVDVPRLLQVLLVSLLVFCYMLALLAHHQPVYPAGPPHHLPLHLLQVLVHPHPMLYYMFVRSL